MQINKLTVPNKCQECGYYDPERVVALGGFRIFICGKCYIKLKEMFINDKT